MPTNSTAPFLQLLSSLILGLLVLSVKLNIQCVSFFECETECEEDVRVKKKTKNWAWQEMKVRVFSLKNKSALHHRNAAISQRGTKTVTWSRERLPVNGAYFWNVKGRELHVTGQESDAVLQTVHLFKSSKRGAFRNLQWWVTKLHDNKVLGASVDSYLEKYVFFLKNNNFNQGKYSSWAVVS